MAKRVTRSNFRVEVVPRSPGDFGWASVSGQCRTAEEERAVCEEIAQEIRRHVDGLPYRGDRGVSVVWDTGGVCEFCGQKWTEASEAYNGGCCSADEEDMVRALKEAK